MKDLTPQRLPADILLNILDNLLIVDLTYTNSKTLLSLALTCRFFQQVIELWLTPLKFSQIQIREGIPLQQLSLTNFTPGLSDLCKRLGWICFKCNNRAKNRFYLEFFSNAQVCDTCELECFPKISSRHLEAFKMYKRFIPKERWDSLPAEGLNIPEPDGGWPSEWEPLLYLYRPEDVLALIEAEGKPVREEKINKIHFHLVERATATLEAMGLFEFALVEGYLVQEQPYSLGTIARHEKKFLSQNGRALLYYIGVNLRWEGIIPSWPYEYTEPPSLEEPFPDRVRLQLNYDEILFHEFRYQFDVNRKEEEEEEEESKMYTETMGYWATRALWGFRPWAPQNIPVPVGVAAWAERYYKKDEIRSLPPSWRHPSTKADYFELCSCLRSAFKHHPEILKKPHVWKLKAASAREWLRLIVNADKSRRVRKLVPREVRLCFHPKSDTTRLSDVSPRGYRFPWYRVQGFHWRDIIVRVGDPEPLWW